MTASMSWERRSSAAIACSSGTSPSLRPPFESYSKARLDSSPTRPCSWCSSPIGRYSGGQPLPNVAWIDSSVRWKEARSRSSLLTEVGWTMAEELGLPRAFFINKLDRERASFQRTLESIQATFGKGCPPLYLPMGEEHQLHGLVGLLSNRAFEYDSNGGRKEGEVPEEQAIAAEDLRSQLIEAVIQESEDEELMDRYLGGETIAPADLIPDLEKAVAAGRLFSLMSTATTKGIGTNELLEVLTQAFPSPTGRPPFQVNVPGTDQTVTRTADPDAPLAE